MRKYSSEMTFIVRWSFSSWSILSYMSHSVYFHRCVSTLYCGTPWRQKPHLTKLLRNQFTLWTKELSNKQQFIYIWLKCIYTKCVYTNTYIDFFFFFLLSQNISKDKKMLKFTVTVGYAEEKSWNISSFLKLH